MGRLYEEFGSQTFRNEAEVNQNFILPLLVNFLGYDSSEIVPEKYYPAKDIYSGVIFKEAGSKSLNHRPDFVICLNGDTNEPRFIIDSKGPNEDIDSHFGQLRSYAISVNMNLLMMTNGKELKVYDVNTLLFYSKDIGDLQTKIPLLEKLLGRAIQAQKNIAEIIKDFDLESALDISSETKIDQEIKRKQILLADFRSYLQKLSVQFANWHLPTAHFQALSNLELGKFDPNHLLTFKIHTIDKGYTNHQKQIKLLEIETDKGVNIRVFIGETGIGKSCLLKFLTYQAAQNCLTYRESRIPIFVSLRDIGHGYKLENLIVDFLNRNGYKCTSYYDLPDTNDFVFFLDAYDEIAEDFLAETFQAIERLGAKSECYLTTRPNRIPGFTPSVAVDILPISEKQIETIIRKHIESGYYDFQRLIENNNLRSECGNILLLLFLISLFKENKTMPSTVTRIVRAVVNRIKTWQDSKHRQKGELSWFSVEDLLGALAYRLMELNETSLPKTECESVISKTLISLELVRKVKQGLTMQEVFDALSETGILIVNNDHLYFWHRLLLNHFAACGLKVKFEQQLALVKDLISEERWHVPIVGLASQLDSVSQLVEDTKSNLWVSAYCLAENPSCDDTRVKEIVDSLHEEMHSDVSDIRAKAILFLAEIDHSYSKQLLLKIPDGHYAINVRIISLSSIGRTRTAEALTLIMKNLDWEHWDIFSGPSSQAHIARGLYYYGEQEHLLIIERWKKSKDWLMDEECRKIFIELQAQQKLTPRIVASLEQFFLSEFKTDPSPPDKMRAMAKILALVPNDGFAEQVIEETFEKEEIGKTDAVCDLIKEYKSPAIIDLLKKKIVEKAGKYYTIQRMMRALSDSVYPVSKDIFYELSGHPDINIASTAIGALRRFPFPEVKEHVEKHLYGDQPQLQSWALDVLTNNGEVVNLIQSRKFPTPFFTPTAHNLLKAVRKYHIAEALAIMEKMLKALPKNNGIKEEYVLAMDLAGTYYYMGQTQKQDEIIAWYFDGNRFVHESDNIHFHILRYLKYFDPALSFKIAECYFHTYFPFAKDNRFKMDYFLDAAEQLGQHQLISLIKKAADLILDNIEKGDMDDFSMYHLERPLRALVKLASSSDEDWLLERLDKLSDGADFEFTQLRRALECLVNAGTAKSLPYIKRIANNHLYDDSVLNICHIAFERICHRERIPFLGDELFAIRKN
jgi:hypothetical protein